VTPEQRALRAKLAAHARWSREDAREGTAAARAGFLRRFELEVDPDGILPAPERARRAESALKAHMSRLALKSSRARGQPGHDEAPVLEGRGESRSLIAAAAETDHTTVRRQVGATRRRSA
jgi:hypothetical protein